jgi:hypothetical protein
MRVQLELNIKPGYVCESDVIPKIYLSASEAINKTYRNLFNNIKTFSFRVDNEKIFQ